MLGLNELNALVWNEISLPNDIKREWVMITNLRYLNNVSMFPYIAADTLNRNDIRLNMLLARLEGFKFPWINDMKSYLTSWIQQNNELINKLKLEAVF